MELNSDLEKKVITSCKEMSGWIKFLGIAYIISGFLSIPFSFGFAIIIAWLPIWLGIILLKVTNGSRGVAEGKTESLGEMLGSLKTFFIVSGVFMIVSIVISTFWFMIVGIATISGFLGETGGFY